MERVCSGHGSCRDAAAAALMLVTSGCYQRLPSMPHAGPDWNIATAAAAIRTELDTDGNGVIDRDEIRGCPVWCSAADRLDGNGDGRIDTSEIEGRVSLYRDARDLKMALRLRFRFAGRPLANVSVRLVPDVALADIIPAIESRTGGDGVALFEALAGAYRIAGDWPSQGLVAEPAGLEVAADVGGMVANQTIELRQPR